jgi:hypothetical protein
VGALLATVLGCGLILAKEAVDVANTDSCYYSNSSSRPAAGPGWTVDRPGPTSVLDFAKGGHMSVTTKLCLQPSAR